MSKNKNIVDGILSKRVTRVLMMLIVCIVSSQNVEFRIPHVQTPSDESSFVCFCVLYIYVIASVESVSSLQMY